MLLTALSLACVQAPLFAPQEHVTVQVTPVAYELVEKQIATYNEKAVKSREFVGSWSMDLSEDRIQMTPKGQGPHLLKVHFQSGDDAITPVKILFTPTGQVSIEKGLLLVSTHFPLMDFRLSEAREPAMSTEHEGAAFEDFSVNWDTIAGVRYTGDCWSPSTTIANQVGEGRGNGVVATGDNWEKKCTKPEAETCTMTILYQNGTTDNLTGTCGGESPGSVKKQGNTFWICNFS